MSMASLRKKWNDLQLALQLGFWVAMTICNSLQFNIFLQVGMLSNKLHELQYMQFIVGETVYLCNLYNSITTTYE
jgi:hypothetical protein